MNHVTLVWDSSQLELEEDEEEEEGHVHGAVIKLVNKNIIIGKSWLMTHCLPWLTVFSNESCDVKFEAAWAGLKSEFID